MERPRIAVIGGGRWARVYLALLAEFPDLAGSITVVSRNAEGMRQWLIQNQRDYAVIAPADWQPRRGDIDAAIVVNAAADHEASAAQCLAAGIPTLIEKPFAMSTAGAWRLITLADRHGTQVAAAHVAQFAPYLDRFVALLPDRARIQRISLTWEDGSGETRYGERKRYDTNLPVLADVLPHVVSILDRLLPAQPVDCRKLMVSRGGAQIDAGLNFGGIPCAVRLARNAAKRVRRVEVLTAGQTFVLDYSVEPGTIVAAGVTHPGDPTWGKAPSPLTRLARSFVESLQGALDPRLDARFGLLACRTTDMALRLYDDALLNWLDAGNSDTADLDYLAAELALPADSPITLLRDAIQRRAAQR